MSKDHENNLSIVSIDSVPYGIGYGEWTAKWWQWAFSIPLERNPISGYTDENCAINQSGPVWFLPGTAGGVEERNCTIPLGKAILLPILNHGGTLSDTPAARSEQELFSFTKREMDIISDLEVTVDSVKLNSFQRYRVQSPIFDVVLPENNLFGGSPGPTRGASDGYWLFLKPLQKGKHEIESFGSCLAGKVKIGVNYHIVIV